jgi:hypothetical protein
VVREVVTASVVGAIAPMVEQAEIERARLKPTENLDAYDLFLRGLSKAPSANGRSDQRSLATVPQGDRTRCWLRFGVRHGSLLLPRAPGLFVDDRRGGGAHSGLLAIEADYWANSHTTRTQS